MGKNMQNKRKRFFSINVIEISKSVIKFMIISLKLFIYKITKYRK